MITFKKFLNETEEDLTIFDAHTIANTIKRDCSKWLKEVKNPKEFPVYRGSREDLTSKNFTVTYPPTHIGPILNKKSVRTDRRPKDTSKKLHDYVDGWLNKQFNIKFRSQSVFVTGDVSKAVDFGLTYLVFPIGDYDYCWSHDFKDMTEDIDNAIRFRVEKLFKSGDLSQRDFNYIKQDYGFLISGILNIDDGEDILDYVLNEAGYKMNSDLLKAIRMGNEIMISCDEYYMLGPLTSRSSDTIHEILDIL